MAIIVKIEMQRCNSAGIKMSSSRDSVLWGSAANMETVSHIKAALQDVTQLFDGQMIKSHTDMIRNICDQYAAGSWDFASYTGTVKY